MIALGNWFLAVFGVYVARGVRRILDSSGDDFSRMFPCSVLGLVRQWRTRTFLSLRRLFGNFHMLIRRVRELRAEGTTTVDLQVTLQPMGLLREPS